MIRVVRTIILLSLISLENPSLAQSGRAGAACDAHNPHRRPSPSDVNHGTTDYFNCNSKDGDMVTKRIITSKPGQRRTGYCESPNGAGESWWLVQDDGVSCRWRRN